LNEFAVIVDIAKKRDYTAIMVMRDTPEVIRGIDRLGTADRTLHYYDVSHIDKFQGLPYQDIADRVTDMMSHANLRNNADLLVDGTGVGEAAVDLIRERGNYPLPIIFTGGGQVREVYSDVGSIFGNVPGRLAGARTIKEIHVPKADLVTAGRVILQQNRLRVAKSRWSDDFRKQLEAFRGKVNEKTNRIKYEAETEQDHDDLVVCYLMGAWWLTRRKEADEIPERIIGGGSGVPDWDPFDHL
jgi:hypothetical protein